MGKIPKIKKKVSDFLVGEEGKISKKNILKSGTAILLGTMGTLAGAEETIANHNSWGCDSHSNSLSLDYDNWVLSSDHSSSTAHSSHCSCTWCCYW